MKKGTSRHPKTKRLARILEITRHEAIGILNDLWEWAGDYATRGNVGAHENSDIADGIDYQGDADQLIAAMVESGWLDENPTHRLVIHDWADNCDEWIKKKIKRKDTVQTTAAVVATTDLKSEVQGIGKDRIGKDRIGKGGEGKKRPPQTHWAVVSERLPEPMRTPTMEAAWLDWEADRRERRKPITKAAATRQASLLAGLGNVATAKATIDKAISHGWTGLYAEDSQTRATTPPQDKPRVVHPPRDAADLIARFNRREIKTINGISYPIGEFRLTKSGDGIQIDGVEIWNAEQLKKAVYA